MNGYMPEDEDLSMLEAAKRALSEPSVDAGAHPMGLTEWPESLCLWQSAVRARQKEQAKLFRRDKDDVGAVQTIWGVDLERALQESGAEISDQCLWQFGAATRRGRAKYR